MMGGFGTFGLGAALYGLTSLLALVLWVFADGEGLPGRKVHGADSWRNRAESRRQIRCV